MAGTRLVVGQNIASAQRQTQQRCPDKDPANDGVVEENLEDDEDKIGLQTVGLYVPSIPVELSLLPTQ